MPDRRKSHHTARTPGRDTSLTTDMADRVFAAMRQGLPERLTARLVGVSRSTLDYWLWRGKHESDPLYVQFRNEYYKAKAEGLASFARVVHQVAHGGIVIERRTITSANGTTTTVEKRTAPNAQAAQWVLERRLPHEYGPNRIELQILNDQVKSMSERLAKLTHIEGDDAGGTQPGAGGANQSGQPDTGATAEVSTGPGGAAGAGSPPHGSGPSGGGSLPFEL